MSPKPVPCLPFLAALALCLVASTPLAQDQSPEGETEPISVGILEASLRPLIQAQVQERLDVWLGLLQEKCHEVSAAEIQVMSAAGDSDDLQRLSELAVELRAERDQLITRVEAVIASLEEKGGDVTEARAFVSSVVTAPPISGWSAAWTTMVAWMTSSEGGVAVAKEVASAIAVVIGAWLLAHLVGRIVKRLLNRTARVSELLRVFAVTATRRTIILLGLLIAASQFGVNMGPMLAAIGALGLVVGLALQGTLSNFASGLMIMVYRPFDVGDLISVAGSLGTVEGMSLVTTTIKTLDNQRLSIPNNMIWGDVITNVTAEENRRVDMVFGIGYGDDVRKAKGVLMDILKDHERVLDDPEPNVQVHGLGDSSVDFVVRPWVRTADYWDVYWDITQAVKERFDAANISIPFPQRDMHVYHEATAQSEERDAWLQPERARTHEKAPAGEEASG